LARFCRLRELRTKPCGCTQDWPNDVQELRASCNEQAKEIHSLTLQREMMNRRDSQQTQQIDDLTQRVRDLERDLKRARQGGGN
jgi:chromosome segregation ATPase